MYCKNPVYKEFCAQIYKYVPSCEEINKNNLSCSLFSMGSPREKGLALQLFELSKTLVQKKIVTFHAEGVCMYPCIRPKDILHIEPKNIEQIKIGDIAVYRRRNNLFSHRTIDKGNNGGLSYIITRSDTAQSGNDGQAFDEDVLGIISYIERKGNILSTEKKDYSLLKRIFLDICLRGHSFRQYLYRKIVYAISYAQQFKIYRKITKVLFSVSNKKTDFSICIPLNDKINGCFSRKVSFEEFLKLNLNKEETSIFKWTLTLDVDSKPAAFLSFIFKPKNCPFTGWWLSEIKIRNQYRSTIVEEKLFKQTDELLRLSGISHIFVSIFKNAYLDRRIFENLGFKETPIHTDSLLRNKGNSSVVRLIMERKICGS
jgi:hypothetical protein